MKVLARRANGLLIVAPICFVISLVVFSMATVFIFHIDSPEWFEALATNFFTSDYWGYSGRSSRAISHAMDSFVVSTISLIICLVSFFDRLFIPKIIIEYDDVGLYIYHNQKDVTVLRYDYLAGKNVQTDLNEVPFWVRYRGMVKITNFSGGLIKTGSIRFECPDGFITVRGVAEVKEVGREIDRMVRKCREEYEKELEESLLEIKTQRELEEMLKHNPNT